MNTKVYPLTKSAYEAFRSRESHPKKILVVDDEASIRQILSTRLSMIGYDVITAADGEEALNTFRQAEPDLLVLDVMMPKLDGYGVCQKLRTSSDVPIIMLTADSAHGHGVQSFGVVGQSFGRSLFPLRNFAAGVGIHIRLASR